ncbi:MAG TPA: Asp-tRNA(Asn)/Glu-tRNA(Gln) amidotransferase subunit GatC [Thermoanaerobacterales bacterium]|jgi:aspartyl-tRNA(Asn)/glutamyl-tRNA(Gln) amidotransferase subunit C|nr:Asp-tRNA(Asn)/Glu-tRNA(Gln) amidotransferase subunit GatC [Thermoanaerobacterales bacterium]
MKIDSDMVEYLANLSRLNLSEKEKSEMQIELNSIVKQIGKLDELDVDNIPPIASMAPQKSVFREDKVLESLDSEDVFKNAPERIGNFFKVPRIIEE